MKTKRQVAPMLTKNQLIDLLITGIAHELVSDYKSNYPSIQTPAKNYKTIEKLVKTGVFKWSRVYQSGDHGAGVYFTEQALKRYEKMIRDRAYGIVLRESIYDLKYAPRLREQFANESWLKYCNTEPTIWRWWNHGKGSAFEFLEITFTNGLDQRVEINCNYDTDCMVSYEERLQHADLQYSRAEIARLPMVELYPFSL